VSTLIEAFRRLPEDLRAQLWLLGDGPLREEIEARAADAPAIRLLRYEVDRRRFAETLASADIYVTAGPFETFALSVIEAQACGLPVVGVDAGALRERVPRGLGYLGPVDDANAMAANIARAASERGALGAAARIHVEQNFAWRHAFATWLACYGAPLRAPPLPTLGHDGAVAPASAH
jgi:alpha-1,6-mannosyltransferase